MDPQAPYGFVKPVKSCNSVTRRYPRPRNGPEVADKIWLVSFMQYDLGFFDDQSGTMTSAENPFGAKVLPMCPERTATRSGRRTHRPGNATVQT